MIPRILTTSFQEIRLNRISKLKEEYDLILVPADMNNSSSSLCPHKVMWLSVQAPISSPEQHFRQLSDYKRWNESIKQSKKLGCNFSRIKIDDHFFEQFKQLYLRTVGEKERARLLLPENWLSIHTRDDQRPFAYVAHQDGRLIGAMIGYFDLPVNQHHVNFLAVEYVGGGVTAGLQSLLLDDVIDSGSSIYYGKDTNLYGVYSSPGLIYNKSKFGLTPYRDPEFGQFQVFVLNKPDKHNWMFFKSLSNYSDNLELLIISDDFDDSEKKYLSSNIANIRIQQTQDVLQEHAKILELNLFS